MYTVKWIAKGDVCFTYNGRGFHPCGLVYLENRRLVLDFIDTLIEVYESEELKYMIETTYEIAPFTLNKLLSYEK